MRMFIKYAVIRLGTALIYQWLARRGYLITVQRQIAVMVVNELERRVAERNQPAEWQRVSRTPHIFSDREMGDIRG